MRLQMPNSSPCMVVLALAASLSWARAAVWTPCDVYSSGYRDLIFGRMGCSLVDEDANVTTTCGNLTVPLNYGKDYGKTPHNKKNDDGKTTNYFVKRVRATTLPSQGEIWLLQGGPGGGGVIMECIIADLLAGTGGKFDIVIPDHRGVGRSAPLNCGDNPNDRNVSAQEPTRKCVQKMMDDYGADYLQSFTVTNAAHDIHTAIAAHQEAHPDVAAAVLRGEYKRMLYGVSYGTYIGQRYLQLYPDEMEAVVLDGVCAPELTRLAYYDYGTSASFEVLLSECGKDPVCAKHLGPHPVYSVHLLFEQIRSGTFACAAKIGPNFQPKSPDYLKQLFQSWSMDWYHRYIIGPVVARALRCNDDDVLALKQLFGVLRSGGALRQEMERKRLVFPRLYSPWNPAPGNHRNIKDIFKGDEKEDPPLDPTFDFSLIQNSLLQFNIALSEMFDYAYTPATAAELESDGELLDIGGNDVAMAQVFEMYSNLSYPTYTPDPSLTNKYPVTKTNILMLQGDTDPQTPYQWAMHAIAQYPGVNQQLVTIPLAVHGSAFPHTSPVDGAAGDSPTPTCGMEMLASFFSSGGTSVDQSCLGRLLAPDFAGALNATRMFSKLSWGTPDLWGSE